MGALIVQFLILEYGFEELQYSKRILKEIESLIYKFLNIILELLIDKSIEPNLPHKLLSVLIKFSRLNHSLDHIIEEGQVLSNIQNYVFLALYSL